MFCFFPVLNCSSESWTMTKELVQRINGFEQWCYRRLLKINWTDKISNEEVPQRQIKEDELSLYTSIQKQKMAFTGHVLRGSTGEDALQRLEAKLEATTVQGRPRQMWLYQAMSLHCGMSTF